MPGTEATKVAPRPHLPAPTSLHPSLTQADRLYHPSPPQQQPLPTPALLLLLLPLPPLHHYVLQVEREREKKVMGNRGEYGEWWRGPASRGRAVHEGGRAR